MAPRETPPAPEPDGYYDQDGRFIKRNRDEGFVIECDGEKAVIAAIGGKNAKGSEDYWAVGQMISVRVNDNRIVGFVYHVESASRSWSNEEDNVLHIIIELVGEVRSDERGNNFSRGISTYPHVGAIAHRIRTGDLRAMYDSGIGSVSIGKLSQDQSIDALISVDQLISRHFAVVGSTGVGKSSAISLLLRKITAQRPNLRVLVLDPHAEFGGSFGDKSLTIDASNLDLPYWMFRFEELSDVVFRGRQPNPDERDSLHDLIVLAKEIYRKKNNGSRSFLKREERGQPTADTPIPYRMGDVLELIDDRLGQLEGREDRPHLRALRNRLRVLLSDSRFSFMFGAKVVADNLEETLSRIFRLPIDGKPICVFEMSNLPNEVVSAVVSVLCRTAFDIANASDGFIETLVICEEAHRYIPHDQDAGFFPTRQAIARIAKEGRKYGVYLGIVTQRPGELDQTILSQCSTIFAMRLANDADQEIIRKASVGAARSTLSFLSSIANRECIAFGEAFRTPMRMIFDKLTPDELPAGRFYDHMSPHASGDPRFSEMGSIVARMRSMTQSEEPLSLPFPSDDEDEDPYKRLAEAVFVDEDELLGMQGRSSDPFEPQQPAPLEHRLMSSVASPVADTGNDVQPRSRPAPKLAAFGQLGEGK